MDRVLSISAARRSPGRARADADADARACARALVRALVRARAQKMPSAKSPAGVEGSTTIMLATVSAAPRAVVGLMWFWKQ